MTVCINLMKNKRSVKTKSVQPIEKENSIIERQIKECKDAHDSFISHDVSYYLSNAKELHLVDVNESCIAACRNRFGDTDGNCHFFYYVNDGHILKEIQDDSMTCLYSWDAMVHFDKLVVRDYIHEFARVLRSGSYGFVHHSNYGTKEQHNEWMKNPGWRSNMTAELFQKYCNEAILGIVKQELIRDDLDCISVFQKP